MSINQMMILLIIFIIANQTQEVNLINNRQERRLQRSWRNINIKLDFYNTQETDSDMQIFIERTIFTRVRNRLEQMIQVQGNFLIEPFQGCSKNIEVSNQYLSKQKTDLIIFVKTVNDPSNFAAYAAVCSGSIDNRPNIGYIVINTRRMQIKTSLIEQYELIFIHEIFHIMVLSPDILKLYPVNYQITKKETRVSGAGSMEVTKLVTPNITKEAQNHFGCASITGLYLENEGTSSSEGSHFDQKHFGNEIMTSKKIGNSVLSRFIFALLEDSSWYKVDYGKAQKFYYGKNAGCQFYNDQNCRKNFREFCQQSNKIGCSRGYLSKTICQTTQFTDNCMINVPNNKYNCHNRIDFEETTQHEYTGAYSRCFETVDSIKQSAGCYKSSCTNGQLKVEIQGQVYECTNSGSKIVIDENLQIVCPDIDEFCGYLNDSCLNDCSGNGVCLVNNQCRCNYFYKGFDCSEPQGCHNGDDSICHLLDKPSNNIQNNIIIFVQKISLVLSAVINFV